MTLLAAAQVELGSQACPLPDFLAEDLTPNAALLWLWEAAKVGLEIVTGAAASLPLPGDEPQPVLTEVLNGVAFAFAGYTHALVALGVLPPEAEEAMKAGTGAQA